MTFATNKKWKKKKKKEKRLLLFFDRQNKKSIPEKEITPWCDKLTLSFIINENNVSCGLSEGLWLTRTMLLWT